MDSRCTARGDRYHGYDPPSFSSTLLDAIYRSFDDSTHDLRPSLRFRSQSQSRQDDEEDVLFTEMMLTKQTSVYNGGNSTAAVVMKKSSSASLDIRSRGGDADGRRSRDRIVDRWMDKTAKVDQDLVVRRGSPVTTTDRRRSLGSVKMNSLSTSSSDSSPGFGFSSSDTDSFYGAKKKKKKSLKPIRTNVSDTRPQTQFETSFSDEFVCSKNRYTYQRPPKCDSAGKTAKSRAMKFYGDLKWMKQPISPGGKLANFLNSLFSASGGSKKQRTSSSPSSAPASDRYDAGRWERESKSNYSTNSTPTCSTASSYSRPCLSKTPSSAGRYDIAGVKRTVRFSPVSVIVDEDLRPCGAKSMRGNENVEATTRSSSKAPSMTVVDDELKLRVLEKNRRVEGMARDLLRNYHQRMELGSRKDQINGGDDEMEIYSDQNEHDQEDDAESCCSSDLFELEIGVNRYCEELPVYETTHVDTNRAIASGLIV